MTVRLEHERFLSQPCPVYFAGFASDTYRLQKAGWQLSVEQDIMRGTIRLAMRFEPARLYMLADTQDYDYWSARAGHGRPPSFAIRHCASNITVQLMESVFDFKPIDATPTFAKVERTGIEDLGIFATPLVRTEEILIEPQSVEECLSLIRKMQAPELQAVRERNARRNSLGQEVMPVMRQNFHAQILSLAA